MDQAAKYNCKTGDFLVQSRKLGKDDKCEYRIWMKYERPQSWSSKLTEKEKVRILSANEFYVMLGIGSEYRRLYETN